MSTLVVGLAVVTVALLTLLVRQHRRFRRTWVEWDTPDESGYSRFQIQCERSVTEVLTSRGLKLMDRRVESLGGIPPERSVRATLGDTGWTLWIDENAAQLAGPGDGSRPTPDQGWVNLEAAAFKTPEELIATLVAHVQSVLRGSVR